MAQQPPPPSVPKPPPDPKSLATLTGQVLNAATGEPVRRVSLTLRPFGAAGAGVSFSMGPMPAAAPFAATTDAEGKFTIEKVEPGNYRLGAERQGFVRTEYGARGNSPMGTTINVQPAQSLSALNFKMTPQAVIKGKVLDDEGEPLARVQIQVLRRRYMRGKQQLLPSGGGMTLDTGEFRIADLAPGRYWLMAVYRSRAAMMYGDGAARNTAGKPEEDYIATYYPNAIDESGARPIDLSAGQELSGVDIPLRKGRVYRIRGKATASGQPLRNASVFLTQRDRGMMGMGMYGGNAARVKEDGTFEIASVPPGAYYAVLGIADGRSMVTGRTSVDVSTEDVDNVSVSVLPGTTLKGAIRIDGTPAELEKLKAAGTTFSSVRVQLMPFDNAPMFGGAGANAKEDGTFELENASAERYRVGAYNLPQGTWLKAVRAGDRDVLDAGLDLSGGPTGPLDIVLGLGVGQVTGIVRDSKQQPAPGALVTLLPDPMKEERSDLQRVATADQSGQFTLQGVAPGDYKAIAWEDLEPGRHQDPELLKAHESSAVRVTVKAAGQGQANLVQVPAEATNPK